MERPASVILVACAGLGLGAVLATASVTGFLGVPRIEVLPAWDLGPLLEQVMDRVRTATVFFQDSRTFHALELVLGAFLLLASVSLLRLRAWARISLEVLAWFALAYVVAYGVFYFPARAYLSPWGYGDLLPAAFAVFFPLLAALGFGAPLVSVIALLRSRTVRQATTRLG